MEIAFHSHANKTHFHKKGCTPRLILKVRVFGTRKWPIETGRGYKMPKPVYRAAVKSVLFSAMFSNTLFENNSTYPWVCFFAPHLTRQRKFYAAFFPNCGNPARPRSRIKPCYSFLLQTLKRSVESAGDAEYVYYVCILRLTLPQHVCCFRKYWEKDSPFQDMRSVFSGLEMKSPIRLIRMSIFPC